MMKTKSHLQRCALASVIAGMAVPSALSGQDAPARPGLDIEINGRKVEVADAWRAIEQAMNEARLPEESRRMLMQRLREAGQRMQELRDNPPRWVEPARPTPSEPGDLPAGGANPWKIGIVCDPVDESLRAHLPIPKGSGLVVRRVMDGSPAARAGVKVNDVLVATGDRPLDSFGTLVQAVRTAGREGKALNLRLLQEGKERVVEIKPDGPPPPVARQPQAKPSDQPPVAGESAEARGLGELRSRIERQQREIQQLQKRLSNQEQELRKLREMSAPKKD